MALQQPTVGQRSVSEDLVRVLLIVGAVLAVLVVLTALLGVTQFGPGYDIAPDPAALSGLPF